MAKIYVKFDDAARTVPTVWTYNFFSDAHLLPTGQLSADLKDDTNTVTGVSLHIDTAFGNSSGGGTNATAGTGEFDESVLDSSMFTTNGGVGRLRLAGIPNGASYTLQLTGHTSNSARHTSFTVEGSSQDYLVGTAAAPTAPVSFTGTVDPDGEIIIDVTKAASGEFYGFVNGFILEYTEAPSSTTINVDIPLHINLKWDTTHQLAVTHDGGTTTLDGVTLSTPTGWETVTYSGSLPAGDSFASLAATDATLGGGGYTMQAGDILAWETQTGLTVDVNTTPVVSPAATVSGSYKIWNEIGSTWTNVSTFTVNDLGEFTGGTPQYNVEHFLQWIKENGTGNSTTEKLLTYLVSAGATQEGATELMYEFLKANSVKLDHMERYWDVSQSIADGDAGFPYTLPINF